MRTKTIIVLVLVVVALVVLLSWKASCSGWKRATKERDVAVATGEQLDRVAKEVPAIRQDQEEKQREVEQIEGADQRLPDGFGAELERVRRGRDQDPR